MKNSDEMTGLGGVFFLISVPLTAPIYQGVFWLANHINWWLGAVGFSSQSLQFKWLCIVASWFLALGLMKLCSWVQSQPEAPSCEKGSQ
ncbi:hypothetical protein KBJ94_23560 [Pseudomonas sp. ITA]|uniref:hypothetical protein n=1 Tax=Pseudomonas sp. ITA TaxID=2825841 RepID=UPI0024966C9D|nr:hypothetical protein [Pseudomonas sp. ITA]MDI2145031.1 hypothetical protein [Pseudomonas sp. ITA]